MRCVIFRRSLQYGRWRTSGVVNFPVFWQIDNSEALWDSNQKEGNKGQGRITYSELAVGCNFNHWRLVAHSWLWEGKVLPHELRDSMRVVFFAGIHS